MSNNRKIVNKLQYSHIMENCTAVKIIFKNEWCHEKIFLIEKKEYVKPRIQNDLSYVEIFKNHTKNTGAVYRC